MDLTAEERTPLACTVTDDGVTHRIWALTDPAEQADVAADLAARTALIADGHHRYAAYDELARPSGPPVRATARGTTGSRSWSTRTRTRCGSARSTG